MIEGGIILISTKFVFKVSDVLTCGSMVISPGKAKKLPNA